MVIDVNIPWPTECHISLSSSQSAAPSDVFFLCTPHSASVPFPPLAPAFLPLSLQGLTVWPYFVHELVSSIHATGALVGVSGPFSMEFLRHSALLHTQHKFNQLLCVDIIFSIRSQNGVIPRAGDRKLLSILPHFHRFYRIHESHENYVFRNIRASLYYNIKFKQQNKKKSYTKQNTRIIETLVKDKIRKKIN